MVIKTKSTITSSVFCSTPARVEIRPASAATFRRTRAPPSCASATSSATWRDSSEWGDDDHDHEDDDVGCLVAVSSSAEREWERG